MTCWQNSCIKLIYLSESDAVEWLNLIQVEIGKEDILPTGQFVFESRFLHRFK